MYIHNTRLITLTTESALTANYYNFYMEINPCIQPHPNGHGKPPPQVMKQRFSLAAFFTIALPKEGMRSRFARSTLRQFTCGDHAVEQCIGGQPEDEVVEGRSGVMADKRGSICVAFFVCVGAGR